MMTNGLWRFFGGTLVAASLVTACGSSGDDEELPGAGGSAGATAGKGGSAGSTGGSAGKGGTGGSTGGTAGTAGKGGSAGSTGGTGGTAGKGGTGGSTGGTGGTAGTAGKGGTGGSTGGTGGSTGGTGGTAGKGGSGGSTGGTGGTAGKGGSGGSTAGSGGSTAGSGGSTAGSGGSTAGSGGSTAGSGGSTAGSGGSTAGSGGSTAGSGGSTAGTGGTGGSTAGSAGSGGGCGPFGCPGGGSGGGGGAAGAPGSCDKNGDAVDDDGDGYALDDCNDCDPNTNPGAIDILNTDANGVVLPSDQQVDEDCSGAALQEGESTTCDSGLAIDSTDAFDGAKAIELCQKSNGTTWGVVTAEYLLMDGKPIPNTKQSHLAHGILDGWGTSVAAPPKLGSKLLVLSSGVARDFADPDHQTSNTANHASPSVVADTGGHLPGFPLQTGDASCGKSGSLNDSIELRLQLKAPTNAKSFSYSFKFYTHEFPQYICSPYNDMFVAVMNPAPVGAIDGNISFDQKGKALSVNGGFLDVCNPADIPAKFQGTCAAGVAELAGTGLAAGEATTTNHAGTTWLQTTAPVDPGSTFTLTYAIADSADSALDSYVVVDGFQWSASPGTVQTGNACKLGGTGACLSCNQAATAAGGCCDKETQACLADPDCAKIAFCSGFCGGSVSCQQGCYAQTPAGQPEYDKVLQCLYATVDTTDPKNKGACGVSCGLQTP